MDDGILLLEQLKKYKEFKNKIKKLKHIERKRIMKGLSMRNYLYEQTGISHTQYNRLGYIEKKDNMIYNKVIEGQVSVNKAYHDLKKSEKSL